MTNKAVRIAMWSGPRNISTTIMRSFENRDDTVVVDEPFYACYLAATGADHPYRKEILNAQSHDWAQVVKELGAPLPEGAHIFFQKHIALHYPANEPIDWLLDHKVVLLIRDPRAMIASYAKKFDDVAPVVDSYVVERRIYDFLEERGVLCPILDANDVLQDPRAQMQALCDALGVAFSPSMLSWKEGPRESDGVWAPHWYDAVYASTGFKAPVEKAVDLSPHLEEFAAACSENYQFLHERRLRV